MFRVRPEPGIIITKREAKIINKMTGSRKTQKPSLRNCPGVEYNITEVKVEDETVRHPVIIIYADGDGAERAVIHETGGCHPGPVAGHGAKHCSVVYRVLEDLLVWLKKVALKPVINLFEYP